MKNLTKTLVIMASFTAILACTKNKSSDTHAGVSDDGKGTKTINTNEILENKETSSAEKAEMLALAGEQLVGPTGFMYADVVFDQALSLDAENKRAQFYKAFLATPLSLRGIYSRVKPLVQAAGEKEMNEYEQTIKEFPASAVTTFLLDGPNDLKTERDIQGFLTQVYDATDRFRTFLKNNKSLDLTLNVNDYGMMPSLKKAAEDCAIDQVESGVFELKECDLKDALKIKMNRGDR